MRTLVLSIMLALASAASAAEPRIPCDDIWPGAARYHCGLWARLVVFDGDGTSRLQDNLLIKQVFYPRRDGPKCTEQFVQTLDQAGQVSAQAVLSENLTHLNFAGAALNSPKLSITYSGEVDATSGFSIELPYGDRILDGNPKKILRSVVVRCLSVD